MWALLEDVPITPYVINHHRLLFDEWLHWVASVISFFLGVFFASAVASFQTLSVWVMERCFIPNRGWFLLHILQCVAILSERVCLKFGPTMERISLPFFLQPVYIPHCPPCKHACRKCQLQNRWNMCPPMKDSIHVSDQVFDCVRASLVSVCVCVLWVDLSKQCKNSHAQCVMKSDCAVPGL